MAAIPDARDAAIFAFQAREVAADAGGRGKGKAQFHCACLRKDRLSEAAARRDYDCHATARSGQS
jgi:hypothetical protein